jgi:hypothetical protein
MSGLPPVEPAPSAPPLPGPLDGQPVAVFVGGLTALIDAGLVLAALLDWVDLTAEQTAGIVAFVTMAATSVGAALRQLVYCRRTVRAAGIASP